MAYKRERRTYIMEFQDPEYKGLEIKVRSIPIKELKRLLVLDPESDDPKVRVESLDQLQRAFAKALDSWNMTGDDDQPLPTTFEYIDSEDPEFVLMCIQQWMKVISQVDDASPLDSNSKPGLMAGAQSPAS
jgi:hypothetical protein